MSNESVPDCLVHKDNRNIQTRLDYMLLYRNETKAKVIRVMETWTDTKRAEWFKLYSESKEQGIELPKEPPEEALWVTMSYEEFSIYAYGTIKHDNIKQSVDALVGCKHLQRRPHPTIPYGSPQYLLNTKLLQEILNEQELPDLFDDIGKITPLRKNHPPLEKYPQGRGKNHKGVVGKIPPPRGENTHPSNNTTKNLLESPKRDTGAFTGVQAPAPTSSENTQELTTQSPSIQSLHIATSATSSEQDETEHRVPAMPKGQLHDQLLHASGDRPGYHSDSTASAHGSVPGQHPEAAQAPREVASSPSPMAIGNGTASQAGLSTFVDNLARVVDNLSWVDAYAEYEGSAPQQRGYYQGAPGEDNGDRSVAASQAVTAPPLVSQEKPATGDTTGAGVQEEVQESATKQPSKNKTHEKDKSKIPGGQKPVLPELSAKWPCAETAVAISESLRERCYTDTQRETNLKKAAQMFREFPSLTREQFTTIFREMYTWWKEHDAGLVTIGDMMAKGKGGTIRLQTSLERLELKQQHKSNGNGNGTPAQNGTSAPQEEKIGNYYYYKPESHRLPSHA